MCPTELLKALGVSSLSLKYEALKKLTKAKSKCWKEVGGKRHMSFSFMLPRVMLEARGYGEMTFSYFNSS